MPQLRAAIFSIPDSVGCDGLVLLVVEVVELLGQPLVLELRPVRLGAVQGRDDPREVVVDLGGGRRLARDDERCPRLVDQDRGRTRPDRVGVAALDDRPSSEIDMLSRR